MKKSILCILLLVPVCLTSMELKIKPNDSQPERNKYRSHWWNEFELDDEASEFKIKRMHEKPMAKSDPAGMKLGIRFSYPF